MSVNTPLNWEGYNGCYTPVAANVATTQSVNNWNSCWSAPTAITKGDGVFVFEVQVSRSHSSTQYTFFGFTPSGLLSQIQAQPNTQHIGPSSSSQTPGFGTNGVAYFGRNVVAQPLASGSINVSQPYTVTLTVDLDSETIGCTFTQSAAVVRSEIKFSQCGVTKDNAKELRVLASWVSDVGGTTATLHQHIEKSAAQLAKEAAATAAAARHAAARPLLEPCTCTHHAHSNSGQRDANFASLTCRSI